MSATTPEYKPVVKRARKIVNCEPCRTNKLKCDRGRPCSSCELRGTVSQCFPDDGGPNTGRSAYEDPTQEIAKMRKSLASLEQFVLHAGHPGASSPEVDDCTLGLTGSVIIKREDSKPPTPLGETIGPGSRGRQSGGLYNGPTSIATHLIGNDGFETEPTVEEPRRKPAELTNYDSDVLLQMPGYEVLDRVLEHYFSYGCWVYRALSEPSFRAQWNDYKNGHTTDRLVLATCCGVAALSMAFLPRSNPLYETLSSYYAPQDAGKVFYDLAMLVYSRYEVKKYSLEHLEFLMVKAHCLLHTSRDGEEIWALRGQVVAIAMAMGLHRDPSQWSMPPVIAERRRWLWWNVLCFDRWQAYLLGRPLGFADHHFDTQLPSARFERTVGAPGCTYVAAIAIFKLGAVLGGIVDDGLALHPVPYARVQQHDQAIAQWAAELPPTWEFSEAQLAASMREDDLSMQRLVMQALFLRMLSYHIRLLLHRPYASRPASPLAGPGVGGEDFSLSADIATSSAEKLLSLAGQYRKHAPVDALTGHLAFMSFQVFSAAMFTAFQLIAAPKGTFAERHRRNIARAMEVLRATSPQDLGCAVAKEAIDILDELAVLWSDYFVKQEDGPAKESKKQRVLARVRKLAFPMPTGRGETGTPSVHVAAKSAAVSSAPPTTEPGMFDSQDTAMPDTFYMHPAHFPPEVSHSAQVPSLSDQAPSQRMSGLYSAEPSRRSSHRQQPYPHPPPSHPARRMSTQHASEYLGYDGGPPAHLPAQALPAGGELGFFPASAGMPWGASLGIHPYEWTAFTQTLGPTYAAQPLQPMHGSQQFESYAPLSNSGTGPYSPWQNLDRGSTSSESSPF